MHSDDVIAKLRSVGMAGYPVKLVVARKVREDGTDDVNINDVNVSMYMHVTVHRTCTCMLCVNCRLHV